jgi:proline iminopeptidase
MDRGVAVVLLSWADGWRAPLDCVLYPAVEPHRAVWLRFSHVRRVYFDECGAPRGKAVLVLHGGPGRGINPHMRRFCDPRRSRAALFDRRACDRSRSYAALIENTTRDLVADIERLRRHIGIERWQAVGGSWGSTLAPAYAQRHPSRVTELVLCGVPKSTGSTSARTGPALFPDRWEEFATPIPAREWHDLLRAYDRRLIGSDRRPALRAARR